MGTGRAARVAALAVVIVLLGLMPPWLVGRGVARADDASLGRMGEVVRPITETDVEMVEEEVTVRVQGGYSQVSCRFRFRNTGKATVVLMGFPEQAPMPGREPGDDVGIHGFEAFVDGVKIPVKKEPGLVTEEERARGTGFPFWWTWSVRFGAGQTREVTNTFRVKNTSWSNGDVQVGYIMTTGAGWKGKIGRARVVCQLGDVLPCEIVRVSPGNYRWEAGNIVWEWENFEPLLDLQVVFNARPPFWTKTHDLPADGRQAQLMSAILRRNWAEALGFVEQVRRTEGLSADALGALDNIEANCRFRLGDGEFGRELWEREVGRPQPGLDAFYNLGVIYRAAGQREKLAWLYRRFGECFGQGDPQEYAAHARRAVQLFLASLLPRELVEEDLPTATRAPFLASATFVPEDPLVTRVYRFEGVVTDPDWDLATATVTIWSDRDGDRQVLAEWEIRAPEGPSTHTVNLYRWLPVTDPHAKYRYAVEAVDSWGNVYASGVREFDAGRGFAWKYVGDEPVRFAFYDAATEKFAVSARREFARIARGMESRLGMKPSRQVVVSLYATAADAPAPLPEGRRELHEQFPWFIIGHERATDPRQLAAESMRLVLLAETGWGWLHAPDWLVEGFASFLAGRGGKHGWMVGELYRLGRDETLEFVRGVGLEPGPPAEKLEDLLGKVYGLSSSELEARWSRQRMRVWLGWAAAVALVALVGLWGWNTIRRYAGEGGRERCRRRRE